MNRLMIEGVEVIAIKTIEFLTFQNVVYHMEGNYNNWSEKTTLGLVTPLFKKGLRKALNNYRGICLLPLKCRIFARILSSRVQIWADNIEALGEN